MKTTIDTYKDLVQEERRLKQRLRMQKAALRDHYHALTDKLAPVERIAGMVKNATTPSVKNPLLNTGINLGIDMLLRGFYTSKVGWIPKLVLPFVLKNLSSNLVSKKGKGILHTFKSLFGKNGKFKKQQH